MNGQVLIIGGGGREHAIAYGLDKSDNVGKVFITPGNAGTALLGKVENVHIAEVDTVNFCQEKNIDLVVVGPEAPLVAGLADRLREYGIPTFGASQVAAQLEGSKAFATRFMQEQNISLPPSSIVIDTNEALTAIRDFGGAEKSVIKADGLASGKGVFLPKSDMEAKVSIDAIVSGDVDKDGSQFVIQKRYHGPELSVFVLSDGENFKIIPLSIQDHKRLLEGDQGPNTGGMGVYAPLPPSMVNNEQWNKVEKITEQSIAGMSKRDTPYQGVLYLGLMLSEETNGDPIVIEYNVRFGDPEAEVIMPILVENNVDIFDMLYATATQGLGAYIMPEKLTGASMSICLAAEGYPTSPIKGATINGLEKQYPNVHVFHGGTSIDNDSVTATGGRVLFVTGMGPSLEEASQAANNAIGDNGINFQGMQYRKDIGYKALG